MTDEVAVGDTAMSVGTIKVIAVDMSRVFEADVFS